MDERRVQCEFFIPIVRNSDKKPHQPVAWNLLVSEIWDTQGQFEAFGARLMPILAEAGIEFSGPR